MIMSGQRQVDIRGKIIFISAMIYIFLAIVALLLVPITEGRSLTVFCGILIAIAIEGLLYAIFS